MSRTLIIGVTGPTGAGKSAARCVFEEYGFRFADCDVLSRRAVEPGMPALAQLARTFGEDIIRSDGTLDRPLLAARAFPTPEGRERLNGIVHPAVCRLLEEIIEECRRDGIIGTAVDAPLLFEAGLERICHAVIAVIAPDELRLERIMARDGIDREAALTRMAAQQPCEYYSRRSDYTVINDGTPAQLTEQMRRVLDDIISKEAAGE